MDAVSVKNVTGKVQVMSNIHLTLMPGVWSEPVPWDTALWLKARGMAELDESAIPDNRRVWVDSEEAYNLLWMSPFSVGDGYATAAENIVHCLTSHGVKLSARHLWFLIKEGLLPETISLLEKPIDVPHLVGLCMATPSQFEKLPTPYKIGLTMYEASDPLETHPEWLHSCNDVDTLFVPTQYSKDVFSEFVRRPIYVTTLAIDPIFCAPRGTVPTPRKAKDKFRIISFGILTARKSPVETVEVFKRAFPIDKYPDVEMVFKTRTGFFGYDHHQLPELDDPRIKIYSDQRWTRQQMRELVDSADCALILSKGEGFGMPAREAIAMGVPTILSENTGHLAVCDPKYDWPVPDSRVEECRLGGTWSIPDWDYAVDVLRSIYNHREEANARAAAGAIWFSNTWGGDRVAADFKTAFDALENPFATVDHRRVLTQPNTETYSSYDPGTVKELSRVHAPFVRAVVRLKPPNATILDLGVGSGVTTKMFADRGLRVIGIDKDPSVFASCQLLFEGLPHPPVLVGLDVLDLRANFLNRYRMVRENLMCTSQGMLEHYSNGDIRRILMTVLKLSEWFVFSVPSVYYPVKTGTERLMRKEQWLDILKSFNVVESDYYSSNQHIYFAIHGPGLPVRGTLIRHGRSVDAVWRPW